MGSKRGLALLLRALISQPLRPPLRRRSGRPCAAPAGPRVLSAANQFVAMSVADRCVAVVVSMTAFVLIHKGHIT